jgi:hypothetical protein
LKGGDAAPNFYVSLAAVFIRKVDMQEKLYKFHSLVIKWHVKIMDYFVSPSKVLPQRKCVNSDICRVVL